MNTLISFFRYPAIVLLAAYVMLPLDARGQSRSGSNSYDALYVAGKVYWPTLLGLEFGLDSGAEARLRIFGGFWMGPPTSTLIESQLKAIDSLAGIEGNLERIQWQVGFVADFYPLVGTGADGFKVSIGMVIDWDRIKYSRTLKNGSLISAGGKNLTLKQDAKITLEANNKWPAAPFVGIGYDFFRRDNGLLVNIEFGVIYVGGLAVDYKVDTGLDVGSDFGKGVARDKDKIIAGLKIAQLYSPFKLQGGVSIGWQF